MGFEDDDDFAIDDGPHGFIVLWADEQRSFETREEAVALAKQLSHEHRVQVDRDDGMESMQFFAGALETFIYETRDKRRRNEPMQA